MIWVLFYIRSWTLWSSHEPADVFLELLLFFFDRHSIFKLEIFVVKHLSSALDQSLQRFIEKCQILKHSFEHTLHHTLSRFRFSLSFHIFETVFKLFLSFEVLRNHRFVVYIFHRLFFLQLVLSQIVLILRILKQLVLLIETNIGSHIFDFSEQRV